MVMTNRVVSLMMKLIFMVKFIYQFDDAKNKFILIFPGGLLLAVFIFFVKGKLTHENHFKRTN